MAPPFSIESLADGNTITLEGMKGKWVYLDFWATTCPPCHPSLDSLNAVFGRNKESWRGQLEVIAVSIDASKGTAMRRIKERRWNQIRHAWTSSEGTMAQAYRIGAIPHGILIAPDGRVAWTGNPYGKDLERFFTDHLYAKK